MTGIRRKNRIFHLSFEQRNAVRGYWFILPWLIGFLGFYAGCLVQLGEFSLSRIGLDAATGMTKEYIGFGNYLEAFTSHATFKQTLASSVMDMLIDLPMIIFFSLSCGIPVKFWLFTFPMPASCFQPLFTPMTTVPTPCSTQ